ncbi:nucleotidyltransferase family protein [Tabrizicola sp.]|uniref:nucleotidyltransferase family protein n=1 Tax=Tabrizicola sp. TaxID=2005166 RepID=UPI003F4168A6
MNRLSSIAHAAYLDLRSALVDEAASEIIGTPRLERRGGKSYWYDMFRVGSDVRKRYIGEDTPEMADRIARLQDLKSAAAARAADRARLIRILRTEGAQALDPATGSLLAALAQTGAFRLGGTIVGTNAFRLYECELGIRISQTEIMQTGDLDIAQFERLSLALGDAVETPLADSFAALDFAPVPSINHRSVWRWRQTRSNTMVEFLTPSFRPEEDIRELPALGVAAQSLHFLNYLIAEPIKAAALYRSGVLVQIPRPEAYAIHKLIVADRRKGPDQLKARKDRAQAKLLIEALAEDRPDELREAYSDALDRGPQWRTHIAATLKRMPETAAKLAAL